MSAEAAVTMSALTFAVLTNPTLLRAEERINAWTVEGTGEVISLIMSGPFMDLVEQTKWHQFRQKARIQWVRDGQDVMTRLRRALAVLNDEEEPERAIILDNCYEIDNYGIHPDALLLIRELSGDTRIMTKWIDLSRIYTYRRTLGRLERLVTSDMLKTDHECHVSIPETLWTQFNHLRTILGTEPNTSET